MLLVVGNSDKGVSILICFVGWSDPPRNFKIMTPMRGRQFGKRLENYQCRTFVVAGTRNSRWALGITFNALSQLNSGQKKSGKIRSRFQCQFDGREYFLCQNILGKRSLNFPTQGAISSNIRRRGNGEKTTMARQAIVSAVQAPFSGGRDTYVSTPPCQPGVIARPTHNNFSVTGIPPLPP